MSKSTKKNLYIFQTGNSKGLSKAELESVFKKPVLEELHDGFLMEVDELGDPRTRMQSLGGSVRITEVIFSGPVDLPLNFADWVVSCIKKEVKNKRVRYGLSMHPKAEKILKNTLIVSKKKLKELGKSPRFVNKDFQNLSSVQAWHEGLLTENAIELQLFKSESHWYMCKTLAIQDFESYSKRDYERPRKDAKNGMLPPKLAQILINLAQCDGSVYDPFCGSGTVLQEAWLMGRSSQGSDLSDAQVSDAHVNLKWLQEHWELEGPCPKVFTKDATQLKSDELPKEPFCIVTESWLGPILNQSPSPKQLQDIQTQVLELYETFFKNLKAILKETTTVVFTAPYHRDKNQRHFLPGLPELLEEYTEVIPLSEHQRPSLFFERKGQVVSREIWKVRVKK